ncbi:MAG: STAS domain-containing protein, partial [Anaerolineaceae bacterium]|nr:STAS domain-containing protein [Anaerolineaceae bacterium]
HNKFKLGGSTMDVTNTQFKHCNLVKVTGRIDSSTASRLAEVFDEITAAGRYKIVVDMASLDFISSAGLRVFINTQKSCKRYNRGEVVLATVPSNIYDALDLAGFVTLFKFEDDVLTAVGDF